MVDIAAVQYLPDAGGDAWPGVPRIENGWRPTGGAVNPAADEGIANWQAQELARRTARLRDRVDGLSLRAGGIVTVGAGGAYQTINEAISALSEQRPAYVVGGVTTKIRLLTGFVMAEQVIVSGINLGWLQIEAEDAEVLIDRAYLTAASGGYYPAFAAINGAASPVLAAQFAMMATGVATDRVGVFAAQNGSITFAVGGVKNAGSHGIVAATGGAVSANNTVFSGAGGVGAIFYGGTRGALVGADLKNAAIYGLWAQSGASVQAESAIATGAGTAGIYASRGASINARTASARKTTGADGTSDFVVTEGGMLVASGGTGGTSITANTVTPSGIIFK